MPLSYTTAILRTPGVLGVFSVLDVADCVLGSERGVTEAKKKIRDENNRDDSYSIALLEAPAQLFAVFGENDKSPRPIQTRRIGGPGRG